MVSSFDFTKTGSRFAVSSSPTTAAGAGGARRAGRAAGEGARRQGQERLRTFPSLMSTPYESAARVDATGQLALIDVAASARGIEGQGVKMAPAAG